MTVSRLRFAVCCGGRMWVGGYVGILCVSPLLSLLLHDPCLSGRLTHLYILIDLARACRTSALGVSMTGVFGSEGK